MSDLRGKTLGQYQLIRPIGAGGMATIYKAYQPALDRVVAVKVLPEYLVKQPGFTERFQVEAQAIAKLDHPHIVPIYDYGQAEGTPYIVMKYVQAGTLKDMMSGPFDPQQAAAVTRQIAEALDHAHQQGIIHRDVKPSNVLMQDGRWVQLTDFGLAKMMINPSQLTASGTSIGTPDYMSPEQAQGEAVDARSDIYSLGVILYQMLTGDVPFHAETPTGVMLKHVLEPPPSPRQINPGIRPASEQVVLRAMAKAPGDRFETASELAEAFEMSLDEKATHRVSAVRQSTARSRTPWLAAIGVLGVVFVAALVVLLAGQPAAVTITPTSPPATETVSANDSTVQLGAVLLDDFSGAQIDTDRWAYDGSFETTLDGDAIAIRDGRLAYDIVNPTDEYYDGGAWFEPDQAFDLVSARVTLLDASGTSDIGIQVNGIDPADPESWVYLAMSPSDASVYAYLGNESGTQEIFAILPGTGMPATRELAVGWDGGQLTFYVDGQPRKSLTTSERGSYAWLLFDVEPQGHISGSFDDVRITYASP